MNIYVKKVYPIKGRDDFFKFVVIKDGSICKGYQGNKSDIELHFDNHKDAQRILEAYENIEKRHEFIAKVNRIKDYLSDQVDNLAFTIARIKTQNALGYDKYAKSGGEWAEIQYTRLDCQNIRMKIKLAKKWLKIHDQKQVKA